jgi:hypothetical protein
MAQNLPANAYPNSLGKLGDSIVPAGFNYASEMLPIDQTAILFEITQYRSKCAYTTAVPISGSHVQMQQEQEPLQQQQVQQQHALPPAFRM